jgi:predicted transcriptional regulator
MTYAEDDRPRDSLGRPKRRKRYPVALTVKISEAAHQTLQEMAEAKGSTVRTLARQGIMAKVHVYLAGKKAKEEK